MNNFELDFNVKIGYNTIMLMSTIHFVLRLALIATIWACVWKFIKPKTQLMRVLRAALLVLSLLGALAVMRITSG
jgi:hypothetical protein